jgi:molybdenum cofactor cytidylyltransferase
MIFGDVPVEQAEGIVLAHTQRLGRKTIRKGTRLGSAEIALLREAGVAAVAGARLEPGDLDEDRAAALIAEAAAGGYLSLSQARTGRCNLIAGQHGVLSVDARAVDAANAVDEAIAIATLPRYSTVSPGDTVATIKIMPLAVPEGSVRAVVEALEGTTAVSVLPVRQRKIGLLLTRVAGGRETLLDKAAEVLRERLVELGLELAAELRCAHDPAGVAAAISELDRRGMEMIIVAGAAATIDRGDVVPAGIERAGGRIEQFGMPVEPGNLLVLGALGGKPVIGMPGCARSPRLNGFDWVLQRLLAGVPVKAADLRAMGVGGLIAEKAKGRTRSERQMIAESAGAAVTVPPRVAAIILAAGSSRRMGNANKLLMPYRGAPLISHAVRAALASKAEPVILVTGHEQDQLRAALADLDVQFIHAGTHSEGMSRSLQAGVSALPSGIEGAVVMLGDMPLVQAATIDRLIEAFDPWADASICIPVHDGKRGNPVLLARDYFGEVMALEGDTGARTLLAAHNDQIVEVAVDDVGVLQDFDTAEDLRRDIS